MGGHARSLEKGGYLARRPRAAVVDAAGNRGSTCRPSFADVEVDVEPPAFLATPTVVGRTATSIDVLVEMSESERRRGGPCTSADGSGVVDVRDVKGNVANAPTGDAAIPNAPTPTVITIPVNAAWLDGPGDWHRAD